MLEGLLHKKKENKEYVCALVITEDRVDACLWETGKDSNVNVLKTAAESFTGLSNVEAGTWEATVDAADRAVTQIETGLPAGVELTKVVFGFFPEWLDEDHIKDDYLKKLKQLTTALSLTPLGFVELPAAVVHQLQKDEGAQQTVILVGLESKHVTVSLYKIGKLVGTQSLPRSELVATDLETALTSFADVEVLPSRVLLYGTSADLEAVKAQLLNHPWQKKANFLHFPKIEVLPAEFAVRAVAIASATEIIPQISEETAVSDATSAATENLPVDSNVTTSEVTAIAEDLGFVDASKADINTPEPVLTPKAELDDRATELGNVTEVAVPKAADTLPANPTAKSALPKLPAFKLPKVSFSFHLPDNYRIPKIGVMIALIALLGLVGSAVALYWYLPSATVKVLVKTHNLDETETMIVDEKATAVDITGKVLPGNAVAEEVTGTKSTKTTGKKTVGEKAHGEVTLYNKTLNSKSLKKGYALTAGKLKFTLDEDVAIASASESLGSLTYGTAKAKASAADIGTASNVPSGTDFTLAELPTTSYSARNDKAFEGGTSRDIAVVSREDEQRLREEAISELQKKAETQLTQKLTSEEKLLENSLTSKVIHETFDREIGDETAELKLDLAVKSTGLTYKQADFQKLLESIVMGSVPSNYEYKKEDARVSISESKGEVAGAHTFSSHFEVKLLPKVQTDDLASKLAGKTVAEATEYMRSQTSVAGVEVVVDAPFAVLKRKLPANSKKIKIEVSAL